MWDERYFPAPFCWENERAWPYIWLTIRYAKKFLGFVVSMKGRFIILIEWKQSGYICFQCVQSPAPNLSDPMSTKLRVATCRTQLARPMGLGAGTHADGLVLFGMGHKPDSLRRASLSLARMVPNCQYCWTLTRTLLAHPVVLWWGHIRIRTFLP
ncbi:uncharacterized protein EI90DRAFT_2076081 [Cantharellus anzutake]|uniref:uncharacterized protein n=1 Tax=Cantharellus anzutake TaxID=1750568 RepID=UPI001907AF2A|nr:uncharacterized protein EI90DRAFT_2076081 [Cantharellus anzutake]KAF8340525.1 hypothetical protein EI90DRAFT_2076081 [Cantharellus anzutake]